MFTQYTLSDLVIAFLAISRNILVQHFVNKFLIQSTLIVEGGKEMASNKNMISSY